MASVIVCMLTDQIDSSRSKINVCIVSFSENLQKFVNQLLPHNSLPHFFIIIAYFVVFVNTYNYAH